MASRALPVPRTHASSAVCRAGENQPGADSGGPGANSTGPRSDDERSLAGRHCEHATYETSGGFRNRTVLPAPIPSPELAHPARFATSAKTNLGRIPGGPQSSGRRGRAAVRRSVEWPSERTAPEALCAGGRGRAGSGGAPGRVRDAGARDLRPRGPAPAAKTNLGRKSAPEARRKPTWAKKTPGAWRTRVKCVGPREPGSEWFHGVTVTARPDVRLMPFPAPAS